MAEVEGLFQKDEEVAAMPHKHQHGNHNRCLLQDHKQRRLTD